MAAPEDPQARQPGDKPRTIRVARSLGQITALAPGLEGEQFLTYSLRRNNKSDFTFSVRDDDLFNAHCAKLFKTDFLVTDINTKEEIGHLKVDKGKQLITLEGPGESLYAKVRIFFPQNNNMLPRQFDFVGMNPLGSKLRLKSKKLEVMANGERGLFFGGRLVMASVKNTILVDKEDKSEVIGIRKIAKEIIELDTKQEVLPIHVFAAGMAAWLGPT